MPKIEFTDLLSEESSVERKVGMASTKAEWSKTTIMD